MFDPTSREGSPAARFLLTALAIAAVFILFAFIIPTPEIPLPATDQTDEGETLTGRVALVLSEETAQVGGTEQWTQQLEVQITTGSLKGETVTLRRGGEVMATKYTRMRPGDQILLQRLPSEGGSVLHVFDFIREPALLWLTLLFAGVAILVGKWTGVRSLLGAAFGALIVLRFILPRMLAGHNPLLVSLAGAAILIAVSQYLVYGFKWKIHAALSGVILSLAITSVLAIFFTWWAKITGLGSEEAPLLALAAGTYIDLRGLVLAQVIIGSLGVLDDICVGQASAIFQLRSANPRLDWQQLFRHGIAIGRDHIGAMVNTLLLVYIAASLPLFALLSLQRFSWRLLINQEFLAEEIILTLVGSLGLMLAMPITSLVASRLAVRTAAVEDRP